MTKIAVREGKLVVPTCPECGCRLKKSLDVFVHFGMSWFTSTDSRGCKCPQVDNTFIVVDGKVTPMWA